MMSQETFAVIKIIKRSEAQFVFFTLLLVGALISTAWGVRNAILYSQDFQWSPAVLFWKGINPYSTWLEGNVDGAIILSQAPNYHQLLYIIFWPLTLLDFEQAKIVWATINISFALGSLLLLKKICSLSKFQFFVIASIFLMSTPFRNTVGNGQQSLLVLFMFLAYWSSDNIFKGIYLAIGFVKYSFAPIFFLLGLLRKEKSIFVTVSLMIFSGLFFYFYLNSFSLSSFIEPLIVGSNTTSPGISDLMSIMRYDLNINFLATSSVSIGLALLLTFVLRKNGNDPVTLAIVCLASLALFQHLGYDYVFLLPVLAVLITNFKKFTITLSILLSITIFFFFFYTKLDADFLKILNPSSLRIVGFLLIVISTGLLLQQSEKPYTLLLRNQNF